MAVVSHCILCIAAKDVFWAPFWGRAFTFQNSSAFKLLLVSQNRHSPQARVEVPLIFSVLQIHLFLRPSKHIVFRLSDFEPASLSLMFLNQPSVCVHSGSPRNSEGKQMFLKGTVFTELTVFVCHKHLKLFCKAAVSNSWCIVN